MTRIAAGSFFTRIRQKLFDKRLNREIFHRMFPHHRGERDYGYPFDSREEMNVQTDELGIEALLDTIEGQIRRMPKAYGESFRHIMHRELHQRLNKYEQAARRRVQRACDPRSVATRA